MQKPKNVLPYGANRSVAPHPADMTTTHATAVAHPMNRFAHTVRRR